jgi:hypothetical protein
LPWHNPAKLYVHVFTTTCSPACKQWNSTATSLERAVVWKRGWAGGCRSRSLTATVIPRPQWQPWCTWALSDTANRRGKHSGGLQNPGSTLACGPSLGGRHSQGPHSCKAPWAAILGDDPCESSNHSMLSTIAHCRNSRRVRGCRQWVCRGPGSVCMGKPPSSAFFHLNPGGSGACRGIILRNYMSTCSALHVAQRASSGIHQRRRWSALWYGNEGGQAAVAADPSQPP